ncbi:hypothetical protein BJF83_17200 [Nocardiopsis sp. CNR-923]|uniref:hypothetical protein n=1 Tax=Nocardiopsis sp. CNR-923 TaxID=1904965 RepID=UPI0009645A11|nr:hypothetical protein [Nocardiopsis sp. CNR-923]OLT27828.1 hypothetical protein BJF83_17200 [Nocardiopsis sp. CNR-923]
MGTLNAGDVVTLLVAVAAVAVCVWVGADSVRRVRGHRFDHPSVLLGTDEQEAEQTLRRGFLERRYALVDTASARVREGARLGPTTAASAALPDPVRVVADLDRDLARLDSEESWRVDQLRARFDDRRRLAERRRATARRLDVACVGAAALVAGGSVAAAVAGLF